MLTGRLQKKAPKTDEELHREWTDKFGAEAADVIKRTVEANVPHYEYLKKFALKV